MRTNYGTLQIVSGLSFHARESIQRDKEGDENDLIKKNTRLMKLRMRSWLAQRGLSGRTNQPVGRPRKEIV